MKYDLLLKNTMILNPDGNVTEGQYLAIKDRRIVRITADVIPDSMAAQVLTPILSGAIMDLAGNMLPLFPYAAVCVGLAFVTMLFVRHGDNKPVAPKDKLEMLASSDD